MGANTACGHYVCHIFKEGKWVIYNDEKVAISENPPLGLGYLYLFERVASWAFRFYWCKSRCCHPGVGGRLPKIIIAILNRLVQPNGMVCRRNEHKGASYSWDAENVRHVMLVKSNLRRPLQFRSMCVIVICRIGRGSNFRRESFLHYIGSLKLSMTLKFNASGASQ